MSAATNDAGVWGMCAAFGCPLLGSLGRAGEWMCACHYDADSANFQAITRAIRDREPVAASALDIRRFHVADDWPKAYRGVQARLLAAGRSDLLRRSDEGVGGWLARLEGELIGAVREMDHVPRGPRYGTPLVPTATITGPTHASGYMPYAGHDDSDNTH